MKKIFQKASKGTTLTTSTVEKPKTQKANNQVFESFFNENLCISNIIFMQSLLDMMSVITWFMLNHIWVICFQAMVH